MEPVSDDSARVWATTEIKVNLGNYQSATFSVGASRSCRDSDASIARTQKKIAEQNEAQIQEVMEKFRALSTDLQTEQ